MGNIPLVTAREGARTTLQPGRGAMSSPEDFGSAIGRATQGLGSALGEASSQVAQYARQQ